jgi:hypothetical protein
MLPIIRSRKLNRMLGRRNLWHLVHRITADFLQFVGDGYFLPFLGYSGVRRYRSAFGGLTLLLVSTVPNQENCGKNQAYDRDSNTNADTNPSSSG